MKRILYLIIMALMALYVRAEQSQPDNQSQGIELEYDEGNKKPGRHRAPIHINIDAYYDAESSTIVIENHGGYDGEVYVYLNNDIIDYSAGIDSMFQISDSGVYRIEIHSESWIATGSISL